MYNLEYVASGTGYIRVGTVPETELARFDRVIAEFNSSKTKHHKLSFLYNAYVEKGLGNRFDLLPSLYNKHADSGGLQIITLGKPNTPEVRDEVYKHQSQHATVGMCFDEIFMTNSSFGSSARTDINTKLVITGDAYKYGQLTGENIKRQIDVMIDQGSECRPMMILHGNHYDDFMNYYEGMCSALGDDHIKELKGSAVSDTCIGNGVLEGADMVSMLRRLDLPDHLRNNVHLLGVGSYSRLMPTLMLLRSGYLNPNMHLSYDSTSHTSGFFMGRVTQYNKLKRRVYNKELNRRDLSFHREYFDNMYTKYGHHMVEVDRETFIMLMMEVVQTSTNITKRFEETKNVLHRDIANFGVFLAGIDQIDQFTNFIDDAITAESPEKYIEKEHLDLYWLKDVKTPDDYMHWRKTIGYRLKSARIARDVDQVAKSSLGDLFDI